MSDYFVIMNSEGDTSVHKMTKEELLTRLEEEYWGSNPQFINQIKQADTNYWGDSMMIIKGEMVEPYAEETITKYEIE